MIVRTDGGPGGTRTGSNTGAVCLRSRHRAGDSRPLLSWRPKAFFIHIHPTISVSILASIAPSASSIECARSRSSTSGKSRAPQYHSSVPPTVARRGRSSAVYTSATTARIRISSIADRSLPAAFRACSRASASAACCSSWIALGFTIASANFCSPGSRSAVEGQGRVDGARRAQHNVLGVDVDGLVWIDSELFGTMEEANPHHGVVVARGPEVHLAHGMGVNPGEDDGGSVDGHSFVAEGQGGDKGGAGGDVEGPG